MKKLKFKIVSIGIGILLSLFLGEIVARVYFFGGAAFSYSRTNSFGILDNSDLITYSDTDGLIYELLPNLDTKYKLANFRTNAEGFRDRNHEIHSKALKIAVLGDSFTMGTGVSEDEMYVAQTEKQLNQLVNDTEFEVFNFGVSGYALTQYKTILEQNALKYQPDLVVIGFCASNDHYRVGIDFSMDDFTIKPKKNVFWDSYLKKLLQIKLNSETPEPVVYEAENLQHVDQQFQEFQSIFTKNNSKGLILYLDLVFDAVRVAQIQSLAEKNNLFFVDVSNFFQNKNIYEYIVNELDPHPNGKANQIFADTLSSFILANQNQLFN
ncbi:GDSL-like lipase/acylhydrolase family protein [Kordia sp. SMS9]|uniref:SGNH/GDSL hydrolase family protein n=1 Tax=Kordia sp. SMS9 TaxID=2282170 RepID=UPI000E0D98E4|nr:SGNH/GDSL hydrolase family protein [Kordia sp. SMS9]AXG69428.1 GDSL-like lipase/acylhydrolase family protein [Kordia sp. SMS9]